jgi:hypothetical protein
MVVSWQGRRSESVCHIGKLGEILTDHSCSVNTGSLVWRIDAGTNGGGNAGVSAEVDVEITEAGSFAVDAGITEAGSLETPVLSPMLCDSVRRDDEAGSWDDAVVLVRSVCESGGSSASCQPRHGSHARPSASSGK